MSIAELQKIAQQMVAPGKGILAADESSGTIKKRFDAIGVDSTETTRRDYRELMFRTPAMKEFVSGVILYDETIWQDAADGTPLVKVITDAGALPGIKVDEGTEMLPGSPKDLITSPAAAVPSSAPCRRITRVVATFSERRNRVVIRSSDGKTLKSRALVA